MPINLLYYLAFFVFSFITSFFLLSELSLQNFKAKLNFLLPYKPDSFSNPQSVGVFNSFFYTLDILRIKWNLVCLLNCCHCIPVMSDIFINHITYSATIGLTWKMELNLLNIRSTSKVASYSARVLVIWINQLPPYHTYKYKQIVEVSCQSLQ